MNYIGIDIGATNLKAGLVDDRGRILATQKMKIVQIESPDALARNLARMTQELAEEVGVPMEEIFSIGVGVPGVVEIRSGSLQYSCNLPFRRVPLRRLFHKYLNKPLYLENDGNCAAVGEYYAGAGRSSKRFVTITLGTGIGGGIEMLGRYKTFSWSSLPGYGWTGITIAILAGNNPWFVPPAAFFMAYLSKGCDLMATYAKVPAQLIDIIQGVIFLFFAAEQFLSKYRQKLVVKSAEEEIARKKALEEAKEGGHANA